MKYFSLLLTVSLLLTSCGVEKTVSGKTPYDVEVVKVSDLSREVMLTKSALMKAGTQVTLSAQAGGRVGHIFVKAGESVVAGETLVQIEDTYGTSGNTRDEAAIALETANITLKSTSISLGQSLTSTKIAYEKALKDYEDAKVSGTGLGDTSKALLDYENYITTQEKTLAGYETTYRNQLQSFQSFLTNVIDTTDTILGVSISKMEQNNSYEHLLKAIEPQKFITAQQSLEKLLLYKNWSPDSSLPLLVRIEELQKVYSLINNVLSDTEIVLINSITDGYLFTPITLSTYRSAIDAYQTQYSTISGTLVTYINTAETFLSTYEKERLSREKAIATTEKNSYDTYILAKDAYETAQKTQELTLRQLEQNVASARVRLRNAESGISRLSITAPVDGIVGEIEVDIGEEITIGTPIITIASRDAECNITVDSMTLTHLEVGTKVSIAYRGQSLPGQVASISPIADGGLNFAVKIGVNADITLFGDFATIDIPVVSPFPTLPLTAVTLLAPGQGEVWVVEETENGPMATKKNVILGNLWGNRIEITSELLPEDRIILSEMKNYNPLDFELQIQEKLLTEPL